MKHIIFNADDFGMSEEINEGIKRGIEAGIINNVSIMVNMPYFDDAVNYLKKHPHVAVGLHFNITEGAPLSIPNKVSLLVREDGNFFYWTGLLICLFTHTAVLSQIETELELQFTRLKKTGLTISHIDSHHHVHLYPRIFGVFLNFALKHKIKTLRGRTFKIHEFLSFLRKKPSLKQVVITTLCFINNVKFNHKKHFFEIDHLYDINWHPNMQSTDFLKLLDKIPDGTTQIICHPAILSKRGNFKFLKPRQKELSLLLDKPVRNKIRQYHHFESSSLS